MSTQANPLRSLGWALACLLLPLPAVAQWTPGGVSLGGYELNGRGAVSDGAGGVIVVWDDRRDGPYPNLSDVYVQRWDATGVEQWGAGGLGVCTDDWEASQSVIVGDGAGGAVVAWVDSRTTGTGYGIYAQHVTAAGATTWTDQGVLASSAGPFIGNINAVADGSGGIVVVWMDYRTGNNVVFAQRVDATGTPLWAGDVNVSNVATTHAEPCVLETLDGGVIVAWSSGTSSNRDVHAQRLDATGARVWNSGVATVVCGAVASQQSTQMVSDGSGGAVLTWVDRRFGDNIYAQRINASGAPQWMTDGVEVCMDEYPQSYPLACPDGTGGAFIVWSDQRDQANGGGAPRPGNAPGQIFITEPDLYMQRIDGTGTAMWMTDGIAVSAAAAYQYLGGIISDGAGGAVVAWADDSDNDLNDDIVLQRYNSAGSEVWTPGGVVHATGAGHRNVIGLVSDGGSNTIPVWTTYIETALASAPRAEVAAQISSVYVQRVDNTSGNCTCGPSGVGAQRTSRLILTEAVPNPSAGAVELGLFLEREHELAVDVFDVRGRRVLAQRPGPASAGWHALRLDARLLPSGVYFYRVTAGADTGTRKIVIQH
ncbi:MAG TPA: T9SS type A sorting domain-containing protein [Candidatus Krumholzibacteria bacterium]|nr:T9SS type A sorting domain-containing protein [Candidatus Krumholzibacteria bacterium]